MIDDNDIARLKEIFVTRQECNTQMNGIDEKLSNDNTRLAVIENQLKLILKILAFIGGGVGTLIIASVWQVIAK